MTSTTDKKLRNKIIKEKTLELRLVIELIKQNTYEKKQKEYNTESFAINKRKTNNKGRIDTKIRTIRYKTKKENFRKPNMQILCRTKLDANA